MEMARKERVTRVIDGDTIKTASRKHPVRLASVDTPERGKPGYLAAKRALARLIGGEEVTVDTKARDAYGRSVANVKVAGTSVNRVMKKHGR
jgi:endonuclease YncB( thermonuclease family)